MTKVLALLFIILLAAASVAGYLVLTEKLIPGERKLAVGEEKLENELPALKEGKAKLEAGKRALADGKEEYEQAKDNLLLVVADKVLKGGTGFDDAKRRIAEGDTLIADGEEKIGVGERRIDEGRLKLRLGREQLRQVRSARIACALGAVCLAASAIVLGIYWRRSLAKVLMHTDS